MGHASETANGRHSSPLPPIAPGDGASQLRRLEVCKEIFVKDQGAWVPAGLIRCRATDSRIEEGVDKAKNAASINSGRSAVHADMRNHHALLDEVSHPPQTNTPGTGTAQAARSPFVSVAECYTNVHANRRQVSV